jgi:catechol 2,3-dioxygenase-like lactoylglutathione lyase family enzyme
MTLDHVVLWVSDPLASVAFYEEVLGAKGVRVDEFREGKVPFPSVRISEHSILDLMSKAAAPMMNAFPGAEGSAGNKLNHVCIAMAKTAYDAVLARVTQRGIQVFTLKNSFGARGNAPEAFYFPDLDGNVLEARHYE